MPGSVPAPILGLCLPAVHVLLSRLRARAALLFLASTPTVLGIACDSLLECSVIPGFTVDCIQYRAEIRRTGLECAWTLSLYRRTPAFSALFCSCSVQTQVT